MLVFLDIKTTGFEFEDRICAASTLDQENYVYELVNDGKKIKPEAAASHHISNQMIKTATSFTDTKIYNCLKELSSEDILVVHDYEFVSKILQNYDLSVYAQVIDTKRVSKHLMSDLERFDLQYLRYELQLMQNNELQYKPLEDVYVLQSLFRYLLEMCDQEKMFSLSFSHVLLEKLSFGKYSGRFVEEIVQEDPNYLQWMLSLENLDSDLRYTIEYYLQG